MKEQALVFGRLPPTDAIGWVQWQQSLHPGGALASGRGPLNLAALTWYALAAHVLWSLILFSPNSALLHHSSYATMMLLFFCGAAWLATLARWVARVAIVAQAIVFAGFWLRPRTLPEGRRRCGTRPWRSSWPCPSSR